MVKNIIPLGSQTLMEKPFCCSYQEALELTSLLKNKKQLWIGFNYRFFPGIAQAIIDKNNNKFGEIISVNLILGHGGAPGNESSWKLDPIRAGGGCLLDPGIHLIDLCHLLSPKIIKPICGLKWQGYWNTGIEEETHLIFEAENFIINFQVSIVKWSSTFRLEINGKEGYGIVTGRGRSYGKQIYTCGKRWGWLEGKNQSQTEEIVLETDCNNSFKDELLGLFSGQNDRLSPCSIQEALKSIKTYDQCLKIIDSV
jgi:predicted dehydrogenase